MDKRGWLIRLREKSKRTHKDIATDCNISRQFYSMIESGKRRPSVEVAKKIAKNLEFDWTKFYEK